MSSRPIWCLLRIWRCSAHTARGGCTSSPTSTGPSYPTVPGRGRNYLDRPLSGSTARRSCCWKWPLLRPWTTAERWSGALCDSWFVLYNADVQVRSVHFERLRWRAERITQPSGPQAARRLTTSPNRGAQCSRRPSRTKSGGMSTCTGPPSSTSLASSGRPQSRWHCATCPGAQRRPNCHG